MVINKLKFKTYKLLKKSEKFFKTDMVYLAKGGFWLSFSHFTTSLISFITVVIFTNLLSPETYGSYKYILSFIGILSIPSLPGIGTAIAQSVAKGKEGSFLSAIKTKIKWSILSIVFGLILATYYYYNNNYVLSFSFILIGIFIPLMESFGVYSNYLHGKKLFNYMGRYSAYSSIITGLILIITVFFTKNIFILVIAFLTSWTMVRFAYMKLTIKKFPPNDKKDDEIISFSKHLSLINFINILSSSLDKILLWHFLGAAQLAVYILALTMPTSLNGFVKILNRLAFPKLVKQNVLSAKKAFLIKIFKLLLLVSIVVITYMITAPYIFKIFFNKYTDSIMYSQIFSLILFAQPISLIGTLLLAQARKKELYILNIVSPIFQIGLFSILIPIFGILGAILSMLISKMIRSFLLIYFFIKK